MAEHKITIDGEKCIGCGLCVKDCVARNIDIRDHKARVLSDDCIFCGHCAAVCPKEAVTISGYAEKPVAKEKEPRLDPEEVRNTIRFRRTVRQFQERAIPREVIGQILEAGGMTHTAKNLRDLSFFVLDREKDRLEKAAAGLFRKLKPLADCISPLARSTITFSFLTRPPLSWSLQKTRSTGRWRRKTWNSWPRHMGWAYCTAGISP